MLQRFEQLAWVGVDGHDPAGLDQVRQEPLHDAAVLEHVRHAGRAAQVVFEDVELAVLVAHQVRAHDVAKHVFGRTHSPARGQVAIGALDEGPGHDAIFQDALRAIDIAQEQVQRGDALHEPALDVVPITGRKDPWHHVEGEDLLGASLVAVHVERDAQIQKHLLGAALLRRQVFGASLFEPTGQERAALAGLSGLGEGLVEERSDVVAGQVHGAGSPSVVSGAVFPVCFVAFSFRCEVSGSDTQRTLHRGRTASERALLHRLHPRYRCCKLRDEVHRGQA